MSEVPLSRDIAVDLGSTVTRVFVATTRAGRHVVDDEQEAGVALEEPTVVAVDSQNGDVVEVGVAALALADAFPQHAHLEYPVRHGVIAHEGQATRFMTRVLRPFTGGVFSRPHGIIAISLSSTKTERRVARDVMKSAGLAQAYLISVPLAGAIGAGLPVTEPEGTCVIVAGSSLTEVAVLSLGSVVAHASRRGGSGAVSSGLRDVLRREYALSVDDDTLSQVIRGLMELGDRDGVLEVKGTSVIDDAPSVVYVEPNDIRALLDDYREHVCDTLRECVSQLRPEISRDIAATGVQLVGAGASVVGLAQSLEERFDLPIAIPAQPERAVVRGAGACVVTIGTRSARELFLPVG